MILVVAATERELAGASGVPTLACGIGPVEAALSELVGDPDPAPIIVAGSLYLVGEARSLLLSRRLEDA